MYWKFLFKSFAKKKLNYIPFFLPIAIVLFLLIMNMSTIKTSGFTATIKYDNQMMSQIRKDYAGHLKAKEDGEEEYANDDLANMKEAYSSLEKNIELNKKIVSYANNDEWTKALSIKLKLLEENEVRDINNGNVPIEGDFIKTILQNKATYTELKKLNSAVDVSDFETKGFTFTYRMQDVLVPILLTICLISLFCNTLCNSFVESINIEDIFPQNQIKLQGKKILFCFIQGIVLYGIILLSSFILSSLLNGVGTIQYPINIITNTYSEIEKVGQVILKTSILHMLCILLLVCVVYIIVLLTKNKLSAMFISTVLLGILISTTGKIVFLEPFLQWIPTTYFNATAVVTNKIAFESKNIAVTFSNGVILLILSNITLITVIFLMKIRDERKQLLFSTTANTLHKRV